MAGTTTNFSLPYPEPSDLVANYPALGQSLAEDLDDILSAGFGKILQVVRTTDSTDRTTTSTSFTDVTGVSVTITPTKSDSALILICTFFAAAFSSADNQAYYQITDSSNNSISGANSALLGDGGAVLRDYVTLIAYATPATTSAVTYKLRYQNNGSGTVAVNGANCTTQFYAIEVSA